MSNCGEMVADLCAHEPPGIRLLTSAATILRYGRMDFFEQQERARRNTKRLVIYFVLAVVFMTTAIYAAITLIFLGKEIDPSLPLHRLWHPQLFLVTVTGTLGIILSGSLYKVAQLREGGGAVARMLGGRPLALDPDDLDEKKLRHVIEEMAIASGTPVPEIYLLDEEEGINAFAAGHTTSDIAIGATRGCMKLLSRDELQGVIGHEFSHILNGDMRLNLRLMGLIHGILCIAIVGRVLLRTGSSRGRSSNRKG